MSPDGIQAPEFEVTSSEMNVPRFNQMAAQCIMFSLEAGQSADYYSNNKQGQPIQSFNQGNGNQ